MKTFYEFIEHKKLESSIIEAAQLMVEMDIDPAVFLMEYISNYPEIEEKFVQHVELQEGIWDTIKNIGSGIKQFGQNVWSGGGIKGGWAQAKDTVMGAGAKFDNAVKTLTDLANFLHKNADTKGMMTTDGKTTIARFIAGVVKHLNKQKDMIPRMQPVANTQPKMAQAGAPAGGAPAGGAPAGGAPAGGAPAGGAPAGGAPAGGAPAGSP